MAPAGRSWRERILEAGAPVRRPAISRRRLAQTPSVFRVADSGAWEAPARREPLMPPVVAISDTTVVPSLPVASVVEAAARTRFPTVSRGNWTPVATVRETRPWDAMRTFEQPLALRRLAESAAQLPLLAAAEWKTSLVNLLKAADRRDRGARRRVAERALRGSLNMGAFAPQLELVRELARQAGGDGIAKGRWGDDGVLDRLRLRALSRTRSRTKRAEDVGWVGFLDWAGRALETLELGDLPEPLLRAAAAALAVSRGYPDTLNRIAALARVEDRTETGFSVRSLLSLRAVLAEQASTRQVDELVPPPALAHVKRDGSIWAPAVVAWHHLRERAASGPFVRLTAALVSSEFRARLRGPARREQIAAPGGWGSPAAAEVDPSWTRLLRSAEWDELERSAPLVPPEWGGPVARRWEQALDGVLGDRLAARLSLLDDRLSTAAGFLLFGMAPSCLAVLRSAKVGPAFEPTRLALARAAGSVSDGSASTRLPTLMATMMSNMMFASFPAPGRDFEQLVAQVREFPDPNVALHSPFWLLGAGRAEAQTRFLKAGDLKGFRRVRELMDHPQHPRRLRPFWLLRSRVDTGCVVDFALWLGERIPEPPEARWVGFIERQARKVWPEWKTRR